MNPSNLNLPNLHHWQEAERAMTAGPWRSEGANQHQEPFIVSDCLIATVHHECVKPQQELVANATGIAALRNREPALLAAIAGVAEELQSILNAKVTGDVFKELARQAATTALASLNAALARE